MPKRRSVARHRHSHKHPHKVLPRRRRRQWLTEPQTAEQLFALPPAARETWEEVTRVVSRMRDQGMTLRDAIGGASVTSQTVRQLAGSALHQQASGQYVAKASDRLLRVLVIPAPDGRELIEIATRDSRQATIVSHYFAALRRFLYTGDASAIETFRGVAVATADGTKVSLLTDLAALTELASAGVLSFESIYARTV